MGRVMLVGKDILTDSNLCNSGKMQTLSLIVCWSVHSTVLEWNMARQAYVNNADK